MNLTNALQDKNKRLYLVRKSLYLFSLYYFSHYWTHNSPPFHKDICGNIDNLSNVGKFQYLVLCAFRGSAKTSFAKQDLIRQIVFGQKRMCLFVSYDEITAKDNLFDVALELQTNKRLLEDFGQLYFGGEDNAKQSKKTGVGNFLTRNKVRVQASSVKKTIRGKVFAGGRPDYIICDDFENNDTKKSSAKTRRVIEYFDEMMGGLSPGASVMFCCNKISDTGSVSWLYDKFHLDSNARIFEKAVIEGGEIQWDRFVMTDKEMLEKNKLIEDKSCWYVSLESLKRTMNQDGRKVFEQEMLNQPLVDGDRFFNTELVDKRLEEVKYIEPEKDGLWRIWRSYEYGHKYVIGVDVSEGYGLDSSVIQIFDCTNGSQVAEYENNYADPDTLCTEVIDAFNNYADSIILPERNSIGASLIALLKERGYAGYIPLERKSDAVKKVVIEKYGFQTNKTTKPQVLFDFRESFEKGEINIFSRSLLKEMRGFSNTDLRHKNFDPEDTITRHFDRLMAIVIANWGKYFAGRNFGLVHKGQNKLPFKFSTEKVGTII